MDKIILVHQFKCIFSPNPNQIHHCVWRMKINSKSAPSKQNKTVCLTERHLLKLNYVDRIVTRFIWETKRKAKKRKERKKTHLSMFNKTLDIFCCNWKKWYIWWLWNFQCNCSHIIQRFLATKATIVPANQHIVHREFPFMYHLSSRKLSCFQSIYYLVSLCHNSECIECKFGIDSGALII